MSFARSSFFSAGMLGMVGMVGMSGAQVPGMKLLASLARLILLILLILLTLLIPVQSAQAHEIGVYQGSLKVLSEGRYVLAITHSNGEPLKEFAPTLPEACRILAPFSDVEAGSAIWGSVTFSCQPASISRDSAVVLALPGTALMLEIDTPGGARIKRMVFAQQGRFVLPLLGEVGRQRALGAMAKDYLALGAGHILEGFDHLMLVFCLVLLARTPKMLLACITAFTLGHSLTLALSFLEILQLSAKPVEAVIALSVVMLAAEVLQDGRGRGGRGERDGVSLRFPMSMAAGIGLLHGLGFASALRDAGVPQSEIVQALLFFNLGVEFGQLAFVALCVLIAIGCRPFMDRSKTAGKGFIRLPAQEPGLFLVGGVAMYWTVQRSLAILNG